MSLLLLRRRGFLYLLRATFSTDIAAPLPASLPVDVGGPLTVVDASNRLSQSGGLLVSTSHSANSLSDPSVTASLPISRVVGRTLIQRLLLGTIASEVSTFGLFDATPTAAGGRKLGWRTGWNGAGALSTEVNGSVSATHATLSTSTTYDLAIILRTTGAFFLIKGGAFLTWTLIWVDNSITTTPLYPFVNPYRNSGAVLSAYDNVRVLDLPSFATDAQVYTSRLVSPAANATTTSTADALIDYSFVYATGTAVRVTVRESDTSNHWQIHIATAGTTIVLNEVVAGSATSRGSQSLTFTNGVTYRVVVICEAAVIKVYVNNVLQITYSSASFNQTATGVRAAIVGSPVSEIVCWPRLPAMPVGV